MVRAEFYIVALAEMKPEDMASNELKKLREKFTKEAINDHQMAQNEGIRSHILILHHLFAYY